MRQASVTSCFLRRCPYIAGMADNPKPRKPLPPGCVLADPPEQGTVVFLGAEAFRRQAMGQKQRAEKDVPPSDPEPPAAA